MFSLGTEALVPGKQTYRQTLFFDLPGQPLSQALIEFALQSGSTVIVTKDRVNNHYASPVVGTYSPEQALMRLLAKGPFSYHFEESTKTYIITANASQSAQVEKVDKPKLTAPGLTAPTLEEIQVTGVRYPFRYHTVTASSQLHSGLSTFETARFLNVLPTQLITDQKPDDLMSLLRNTSGITPGDGLADSNDDFFIRGFPRHGLYMDGFRLDENTGTKVHPYQVERVEILKGPSTLRYGQAEPGGVVNVVTKSPVEEEFRHVQVATGSGNRQEAGLDFGGQLLPQSDRGYYRLIVNKLSQDRWRDLRDYESELIAPSFRWFATDNTIFNVSYEKQKKSQIRPQGTIILTPELDSLSQISIAESTHRARPDFQADFQLLNVGLNYTFSDHWRLNAKYVWQQEDRLGIRGGRDALLSFDTLIKVQEIVPNNMVAFLGLPIVFPTGSEVKKDSETSVATLRSIYDEQGESRGDFVSLSLEGSPALWGMTHHFLVGFDWHKQRLYERYVLEKREDIKRLSLPNKGSTTAFDKIESIIVNSDTIGELTEKSQWLFYEDYGFYWLDNIELSRQWVLSLGGRYTQTEAQRENSDAMLSLSNYKEWSSQFGLVYKPVDDISLYFNYSESMKPNYKLDEFGTRLARPELSDQIELGFKSLWFDGRLQTTASVFEINKDHIVDVTFVDQLRQLRNDGEQTNRGFEMDITSQLVSNIDIIVSFSIIDANISTGLNQGNRPALSSDKTGSAFLNYRFLDPVLKGLQLNIGSYYVGNRYIDNANSKLLKDYYTVDLGASYDFSSGGNDYKVQINARNILDETYLTSAEGAIRTSRGAGRSVIATVEMAF